MSDSQTQNHFVLMKGMQLHRNNFVLLKGCNYTEQQVRPKNFPVLRQAAPVFLSSAEFTFSKKIFQEKQNVKKFGFRTGTTVGPDLCPDWLQRLLANYTSRQNVTYGINLDMAWL